MKKNNFLSWLLIMSATILLGACNKEDNNNDDTKTTEVGALLSLTGNWSTLGISSQAAMTIAANDINTYFKSIGFNHEISTKIYDTKLETALATQMIAEAKAAGIKFIIGPQSSAEVGAVKSFADANNMLVVSQGSTAGAYAIANDNIFRFCPADNVEGPAMANSMYKAGKRNIVTLSRDDAGNKGLQNAVSTAFKLLGGLTTDITPYVATTTNFAPIVADLKAKLTAAIAISGVANTAVYYASFDEFVALFNAAANDPILTSVNWYGADGVVLSTALTSNAIAADFAIATHFFAPNFGLPVHTATKTQAVIAAIKSSTSMDPDAFALSAYDAMWVIANTILATANIEHDFSKIKSNFNWQANAYYGVTGATELNEYGDRKIGSYDYWGISKVGNNYQWTFVGKSE